MKVSTRKCGVAIVLDLDGQLTAGTDTRLLWESLASVGPADDVVLDLQNNGRLDCAGIGVLVDLHRALHECGAMLTLVNLEPRQKRMLELVGLLRVLHISNDLASVAYSHQ
jgi:anti-anti-sigma factor